MDLEGVGSLGMGSPNSAKHVRHFNAVPSHFHGFIKSLALGDASTAAKHVWAGFGVANRTRVPAGPLSVAASAGALTALHSGSGDLDAPFSAVELRQVPFPPFLHAPNAGFLDVAEAAHVLGQFGQRHRGVVVGRGQGRQQFR